MASLAGKEFNSSFESLQHTTRAGVPPVGMVQCNPRSIVNQATDTGATKICYYWWLDSSSTV